MQELQFLFKLQYNTAYHHFIHYMNVKHLAEVRFRVVYMLLEWLICHVPCRLWFMHVHVNSTVVGCLHHSHNFGILHIGATVLHNAVV